MNKHAGTLSRVVSLVGLALAITVGGCSSSNEGGSGGSGSGGSGPGSGGAGSGGSGSGGTSSGGTNGSGGAGSGGANSSGGASSGGSNGSGGASSGGSNGSGGASRGGSPGSGGGSASGGNGGGQAGGRSANGSGGAGAGGGSGSGTLTLTSPDHADGDKFDMKFTCAESPPLSGKTVGGLGNGINPELDWSAVPAGTMSFAITFLDTTLIDANMAQLGNHWAIWNIPATVTKFPQGTTMLSADLMMAKQSGAFLSPCAQSLMNGMDDKYEFTLYALPTATLNVTGTSVANAVAALKTATPLGTAKLHGHAGVKGM